MAQQPQPPRPRPLRETAPKCPRVWGGEGVAGLPRATEGLSRDREGLSRGPLWTAPGSGESKALVSPPQVSASVLSGVGDGVPFPPGVPWGPGVDPHVSLSRPKPRGRSPSPPCPPHASFMSPLCSPARDSCTTPHPQRLPCQLWRHFRRAITQVPVGSVRAFSRRSPTPMAGSDVGGAPRPSTPSPVRDLRGPRAAAEGISPFRSGGDPG